MRVVERFASLAEEFRAPQLALAVHGDRGHRI
jgi:hypothetical protein